MTKPSTRSCGPMTGSARTMSDRGCGSAVDLQLAAPAPSVAKQVLKLGAELGRRGKIAAQVTKMRQMRVRCPQLLFEGFVQEKNAAFDIGNDDGLFRKRDLAADGLELMLGNDHPHRAELQRNVGHGLANHACGRHLRR